MVCIRGSELHSFITGDDETRGVGPAFLPGRDGFPLQLGLVLNPCRCLLRAWLPGSQNLNRGGLQREDGGLTPDPEFLDLTALAAVISLPWIFIR